MNENRDSDIQAATRRHLAVFGALALCTILVVSSAFLPIDNRTIKMAITLSIAVVEAILVAGFLMHLISERKLIFSFLALTAVFFIVLLFLPTFAQADHIGHFFAR